MQTPRVAFYTLGCKVNQYESFAMMRQFEDAGFALVEPEEQAEVYVVNSCTVTATGDKKSRQVLRRFRRQNPQALLVLCGCFPQAFPEEAAAIPQADLILGAKNRGAVVAAVEEKLAGKAVARLGVLPHNPGEPFEPMTAGAFASRTRAFVKIEDGCQRRCAYCIIPTARGPVRSRPLEDLKAEVTALGQKGYREVVLAGINLNCYGQDLGLTLTDALALACRIPGIRRVRLGSLEPELLTKPVIERWAELPGLCPQFHLSLQSGCDATLARMRRHYDTARYREIAAALRAAFPGCALTTDVMVGFPGETEEEFAQSLAFVEEIAFARAHIFVYSPRPGTPAAEMPHPVAAGVAARRAAAMAAATRESQREFLQSRLGQTLPVLLEQREKGCWVGYTPCYTPVAVAAGEDLAGEIREVTLTAVEGDRCLGSLA